MENCWFLSLLITAKAGHDGCFRSCLDQRIAPWVGECIVVNNRSADGTEAAVQDWMARYPDAPVRLLRNDQNYGLGGSHKVAFGYAAAHGYEHLVVLHGDDQGAIADLLPILNDGTYKNTTAALAPAL